MSEELGSVIPAPLRFEFGAHPTGEAAKAVLLVTHDPDGLPRVAVVAASRIEVRSPNRLAFAVHKGSATQVNLERTGRAGLWCVLDAAAYCLRGRVMSATGVRVAGDDMAEMELTVESVLRDFHPSAPLVSGPAYRRIVT